MNRNQTEKVEEISGFFISTTPEESAAIHEFLEANEYEPNPKGLKEFILDEITEDEEPEKETFFDKAAKNPELIKQGVNAAASIFKTIRQNRKRPR